MSIGKMAAIVLARRKRAKSKPAPKPALKEMPKAVKSKPKKAKKEEPCEKQGCERPATECEDHVDCDPCEDE